MAIVLYEHPLSPYVRKVKIVLYEKGIEFERPFVTPGDASEEASKDFSAFAKSSPRLEVPALVDGGTRIFDSTIILEYIEEKYPNPPAQPADPAERARIRMLEEMCDTELEAINWGLMEIHFFKRAEGARASDITARAAAQLKRIWGVLERELENRDWMTGKTFGRGDAAVYPHISNSATFGFAVAEEFPRLRSWTERAANRPSVRRDAAEVREWMEANLGTGTAAMPTVRQYRDHRLEWMMKTGGREIVLTGLDNGTIKFAEEFA